MKLLKIMFLVLIFSMLFSACDDRLKVENNPNITAMFLVGDAVKGWRYPDKTPAAVPMMRTGETTFEFRGNLTPGFLKISCDEIPDWDGSWYLPPKTDTRLNTGRDIKMAFTRSGDGGETGPKWEITEAALYRIVVNKAQNTVRCLREDDFIPEGTNDIFTNMWFILCHMNAPESIQMKRDGEDWVLERQRILNNQYVKFYGEALPRTDWDTPDSLRWFCPLLDEAPLPGPDTPLTELNKLFTYGGDNTLSWGNKEASAFFKIILSPRTGTVSFEVVP